MKNFLLCFLLFSFNYINIIAQVDTSWVRRFNGPAGSEDVPEIMKIDNNGFIYVAGKVSTIPGYLNYGVIKYSPDGDSLWFRYYNSPVNRESLLRDMAIDNNNNIIVTGSSDGTNYHDFATVKWDSDGNLLWAKRYDGGSIDQAYALDVDGSGNICVTGLSDKSGQNNNYFTIKYSPDGDTLWTHNFAGPESASDVAKAIAVDNTGSIVVSGVTDYYWGTVDILTIKLNPSGDTVWTSQYNSPQKYHDYFCDMALDASNNIYIAGQTLKTGTTHDIVLIKYNPYGDTLWTYTGSLYNNDYVYDIVTDNAGNVYVAGASYDSSSGFDYLTIKFNSSGVLQWAKTYDGYSVYNDNAQSIAVDNSGNVYVTGSIGKPYNNSDIATVKYDSDGNEKWAVKYQGPEDRNDYASSICLDNSGNPYITGYIYGPYTGFDFVTIKYTETPIGLHEILRDVPETFKLFENFPDPFNPVTKIKYSITIPVKIELIVYDILGNKTATLVNEEKPAGIYELEFDASLLPSGVYFYQLRAGSFSDTKKMLLMR